MTFEEILDQAVAMLQRRGQVTYRTLKRQFDLDDEALEDLKDELLYSHPVRDDEGKGLIWTGEPGTQPEPASTPPVQPEVTEQARAELSTAIEMYRDMEMTFWLPETEAALADVEGRS